MTDDTQATDTSVDAFDLASVTSFSLNQRILPGCALSARVQPDDHETLVVAGTSNKIMLRNNETTLHISDKIKCLTTAPFGDNYDYIVVGTESQVGKLADLDRMILCGGNCAIWGFDETGRDIYWTVTGVILDTHSPMEPLVSITRTSAYGELSRRASLLPFFPIQTTK
ncbi:hypothetical protein KIN20_027885 [Parelaphostrongylus tenuis]|uniref:Ciliary BBSome complex subunit 2 middle region domain-containing protein n=1 Tax=Parelaphostrongylus tenuis TaxID=148309 RepID=A0AAD5QZY6_PARTN|nr:hypothetical protein KIN20_027885 [Parelaphostrongylus tenuis]